MILTRRRGGTEEDAQKQRGSQGRRARRQRRSGGYAARRARQGKFGENAMTKNQRIAGRFPEREGSRTYGARPNVFSGAMDGLSPPPVRAPPMALAVQVLPDRADLISETMPQLPNRSLTVVWKPMVVCPQPDFYRRMQTVLTELALEQPCTLAEYPRGGTIAALAERNACNVCFIDVATDSERAQLLISELAPSVPVVALPPRNDADLILRCLRRGACEFVADPTADALGSVFERLGGTRQDAAAHLAGRVQGGGGHFVLRGARQAGLRREHARRPPGDSIAQRRRQPGPAGGWRSLDGQHRVHAQIETAVSPGRRHARLGADGR